MSHCWDITCFEKCLIVRWFWHVVCYFWPGFPASGMEPRSYSAMSQSKTAIYWWLEHVSQSTLPTQTLGGATKPRLRFAEHDVSFSCVFQLLSQPFVGIHQTYTFSTSRVFDDAILGTSGSRDVIPTYSDLHYLGFVGMQKDLSKNPFHSHFGNTQKHHKMGKTIMNHPPNHHN